MDRPNQQPEEEISRYLSDLDHQLTILCESGSAADPESLDAAITQHASRIESAIDRMIESATPGAPLPADFEAPDQVVDYACRETLLNATRPLAIKTSRDEDLPKLRSLPSKTLLASLQRAMQIVVEFASNDSDLHVHVGSDGRDVIVTIQAEVVTRPDEIPIELRTCTLADVLDEIASRVRAARTHNSVELQLSLPTRSVA